MPISRTILAAAAAGLLAAAPAQAQVGATMEEARAGELWTAYGLRLRETPDPLPAREYRPAREPLASRALVTVVLADDGTIAGMALRIGREVVEHPEDGRLARELTARFLRAAMPADDRPDVEEMVRVIEHPQPHAHAAEGAQAVYLGYVDAWSRTLEASTLRVVNEPGARGPVLVVSVQAR